MPGPFGQKREVPRFKTPRFRQTVPHPAERGVPLLQQFRVAAESLGVIAIHLDEDRV
jgi:hypothetical protein